MVEVRYLSVALLATKGIRSGAKGNIAEIYISLPGVRIGLQKNILQTVTFVKRFRSFKIWFV